jgi:hypothetical protein
LLESIRLLLYFQIRDLWSQSFINDEVNGFLLPINVKSLKIDAVSQLDDVKIKEIQEYNKKLVLEKFDFKKNFSNLKKVLKKGKNLNE